MDKPTELQIKEFWEWCGITQNKDNDSWANGYPCYDSLDDLFEYAVPKAVAILKGSDHEFFGWKRLFDLWYPACSQGVDPALALFWTLWQVKEIKKDKTRCKGERW